MAGRKEGTDQEERMKWEHRQVERTVSPVGPRHQLPRQLFWFLTLKESKMQAVQNGNTSAAALSPARPHQHIQAQQPEQAATTAGLSWQSHKIAKLKEKVSSTSVLSRELTSKSTGKLTRSSTRVSSHTSYRVRENARFSSEEALQLSPTSPTFRKAQVQ